MLSCSSFPHSVRQQFPSPSHLPGVLSHAALFWGSCPPQKGSGSGSPFPTGAVTAHPRPPGQDRRHPGIRPAPWSRTSSCPWVVGSGQQPLWVTSARAEDQGVSVSGPWAPPSPPPALEGFPGACQRSAGRLPGDAGGGGNASLLLPRGLSALLPSPLPFFPSTPPPGPLAVRAPTARTQGERRDSQGFSRSGLTPAFTPGKHRSGPLRVSLVTLLRNPLPT